MPAKLAGRTTHVAVGTSHFTFFNFRKNPLPPVAIRNHFADSRPLLAPNVVKVENHRIMFAAINAGMFLQIS
jgi:hypothetical protein